MSIGGHLFGNKLHLSAIWTRHTRHVTRKGEEMTPYRHVLGKSFHFLEKMCIFVGNFVIPADSAIYILEFKKKKKKKNLHSS